MARKKYKTEEERLKARKEASKRWYNKHKNDPKQLQKRAYYQAKYYDKLNVNSEEFLKDYNTEYKFYLRNIHTGKLQRKIVKAKKQVEDLSKKIEQWEQRLVLLKIKFLNLETKFNYKSKKEKQLEVQEK